MCPDALAMAVEACTFEGSNGHVYVWKNVEWCDGGTIDWRATDHDVSYVITTTPIIKTVKRLLEPPG